jgi:hypothetical protein
MPLEKANYHQNQELDNHLLIITCPYTVLIISGIPWPMKSTSMWGDFTEGKIRYGRGAVTLGHQSSSEEWEIHWYGDFVVATPSTSQAEILDSLRDNDANQIGLRLGIIFDL